MILTTNTHLTDHHRSRSRLRTATALVAGAALLAACGAGETDSDGATPADDAGSTQGPSSAATAADDAATSAPVDAGAHDDEHAHEDEGGDPHADAETDLEDGRATTEVAGPEPRLGVTYDGGVLVLDGLSLEVLADFPAEGFTRLNPAGDDRHLLLTVADGFQVLDTGTWSVPHGDHDHSYTTEPLLTDLVFPADHGGHVVPHGGTTALFADGTGEITTFATEDLEPTALPDTETVTTPEAHHGVAVVLEGGELLHTVGDEDSRSGATVVEPHGDHTHELALNEECPGVHGETVAADERVVLGCEDGVLVYADGEFTTIDAPDEYGRIGNVAGHPDSPVVLGDYTTDPDAGPERPTRVALVDTQAQELRLVELGTSYTFRSLARGPEGEALVLGTDGSVHVLDPVSGEVTEEIPVVAAWEEPQEWQDPRPTIRVQGDFAYVSEPATDTLHVLDLAAGEVIDSAELPQTPNELSSVGG